jgi:Tol biopolymer transport system component
VYRDAATGNEREILAPGNADFASIRFDVSPDGRQLAVMGMAKATGELILRLLPVAGGTSRELLRGDQKTGLGWVTWTPDGKFLLFTRYGSDETLRGLWYISTAGGQPRKVTVSGVDDDQIFNMAVHPDGKQLAFTTNASRRYQIWAMENFLPPLKDSVSPAAAAGASATKTTSAP